MEINYFKDDADTVGNRIIIYSWGRIDVGESYIDGNGDIESRSTSYYAYGTTEESGDHSLKVESISKVADFSEFPTDTDFEEYFIPPNSQ